MYHLVIEPYVGCFVCRARVACCACAESSCESLTSGACVVVQADLCIMAVHQLSAGQEVRNIIGSSAVTGGAKEYWCKRSGQAWPAKCSAFHCKNAAEHGGHVKLDGGGLDVYWDWFIVPVCQKVHNKPASNTEFKVIGGTVAVEDDRAGFKEHAQSWAGHFK
jgi:hypothetical protein